VEGRLICARFLRVRWGFLPSPLCPADNRSNVRYQIVTEFREIAKDAVCVTAPQIESVTGRSRWDRMIPPLAARRNFSRQVERVARRCQDQLAKAQS
jgi:hypothetical protein